MLSIRGLLIIAATSAVASAFDLSFSSIYCPPEELVLPCTCDQNNSTKSIEVSCRNIEHFSDLEQVFKRIPQWSFTTLNIVRSVFTYIPTSVSDTADFKYLNVSGSTFITLFPEPPSAPTLRYVNISSSVFQRGLNWNLFNNTGLQELVVEHTKVRAFSNSFGRSLPGTVRVLTFINTKTTAVASEAFAELHNVESLTLSQVGLRSLKRSMFARPGNYVYLDFSDNKISTLPDDIFEGMDRLRRVNLKNNLIPSTWETVFGKKYAQYLLDGNPLNCICHMKWYTLGIRKKLFQFTGECVGPSTVKGKQLNELTENDFRYCK